MSAPQTTGRGSSGLAQRLRRRQAQRQQADAAPMEVEPFRHLACLVSQRPTVVDRLSEIARRCEGSEGQDEFALVERAADQARAGGGNGAGRPAELSPFALPPIEALPRVTEAQQILGDNPFLPFCRSADDLVAGVLLQHLAVPLDDCLEMLRSQGVSATLRRQGLQRTTRRLDAEIRRLEQRVGAFEGELQSRAKRLLKRVVQRYGASAEPVFIGVLSETKNNYNKLRSRYEQCRVAFVQQVRQRHAAAVSEAVASDLERLGRTLERLASGELQSGLPVAVAVGSTRQGWREICEGSVLEETRAWTGKRKAAVLVESEEVVTDLRWIHLEVDPSLCRVFCWAIERGLLQPEGRPVRAGRQVLLPKRHRGTAYLVAEVVEESEAELVARLPWCDQRVQRRQIIGLQELLGEEGVSLDPLLQRLTEECRAAREEQFRRECGLKAADLDSILSAGRVEEPFYETQRQGTEEHRADQEISLVRTKLKVLLNKRRALPAGSSR